MALFNASEFSGDAENWAQPTDTCFYCGEALTGDNWIYWNGNADINNQIWMHPHCAKRLADHLTSDWAKFSAKNPQAV